MVQAAPTHTVPVGQVAVHATSEPTSGATSAPRLLSVGFPSTTAPELEPSLLPVPSAAARLPSFDAAMAPLGSHAAPHVSASSTAHEVPASTTMLGIMIATPSSLARIVQILLTLRRARQRLARRNEDTPPAPDSAGTWTDGASIQIKAVTRHGDPVDLGTDEVRQIIEALGRMVREIDGADTPRQAPRARPQQDSFVVTFARAFVGSKLCEGQSITGVEQTSANPNVVCVKTTWGDAIHFAERRACGRLMIYAVDHRDLIFPPPPISYVAVAPALPHAARWLSLCT
jgi:hypothetical protein